MYSCIILPFNYFSRRYKRIYFQEFEKKKKLLKRWGWIANRANLIGGLGKVHRHFQRAASVNPVCFSADASWCRNIRSNRHQERGDKNGCGHNGRMRERASVSIFFFFFLSSFSSQCREANCAARRYAELFGTTIIGYFRRDEMNKQIICERISREKKIGKIPRKENFSAMFGSKFATFLHQLYV